MISFPADYRLPQGRAIADMMERIFRLQCREVLDHAQTRRTPVNFNGWIDYATDKLLPLYVWHAAQGWKFQSQRLDRVMPGKKSLWAGFFKAQTEQEKKDKKELLALLLLLGMMNPAIVEEVRLIVREIVQAIFATTSKWVNAVLGAGLDNLQTQRGIAAVFARPDRARKIGELEASRAFHYGMLCVLRDRPEKWYKTWVTAKDEDVCPICRPLHEKTIPLDDWFVTYTSLGMSVIFKHPPAHAGTCRCRLRIYMEVPAPVLELVEV